MDCNHFGQSGTLAGFLEPVIPGICSIDDGSGGGDAGAGGASGGAGGGAAALDGAAAALAAGGSAGGAASDGAGGAGDGTAAGADPEWLESFSAEGGDADNPSNRDWLKSKGFKTLDDVAKSYREAEHAIRNGGKLVVPGENAKPEEVAAFNKAIGVPDKAEDYTVTLPEGVQEDELDMGLLNGLRSKALEAGTPAKAFDKLAAGVIQSQLDALAAQRTAENGSRDDLFKEWGAQKDAKMADVQNAMRALDLKREDVAAMQRGFAMQYGEPGSKRTLELLQKLGAGMAEDTLLGGEGPRRFGVTGEQAQAELDKLAADKEFGAKIVAKDPEATARYDRLIAAVAADRERKNRAAQ